VKAELVSDAHAELGEGPLWDIRTSELLWVDIPAGVVHRFDPRTGADRPFDVGRYVGAVVPRAAGGYALAVAEGFALAFRLNPDQSVTSIEDGVTISNGIGWSPDDSLLYYVDTERQAVDVFDFDAQSGGATNRRELFPVEGPGAPDGLVVDAEGLLWVALWGGACVRRYSPDGVVADVVEVPAAHTTKPAFGGPALTHLYITTAAGDEPHAGGLFVAQPGVAGLPANAYAG